MMFFRVQKSKISDKKDDYNSNHENEYGYVDIDEHVSSRRRSQKNHKHPKEYFYILDYFAYFLEFLACGE